MPEQPTRAQFEAAAKKVMETAPEGLSKDQFYALVDAEISRQSYKPQSVLQMGRESLGVTSDEKTQPSSLGSMLQHAAHPQSIGDFLQLVIPGEITPALRGLSEAYGKASRIASELPTTGSMVDRVRRFGQAALQSARETPIIQRRYNLQPEEMADVLRNPGMRSGDVPGRLARNPADLPSTLDTTGPMPGESVRSQIPPRQTPTPPPGRLTGTKAKSIEEVLNDALAQANRREAPSVVSGRPEISITEGGPLRQSGKFKKSDSLGAPGGYSSGRPAVPDDLPLQDLTDRLRKAPSESASVESAAVTSEPTPYHSTEPAEWHSGAEPGSTEAQQAQSLHRYEGEMTAGYRRRLDDERGMSLNELLQALAGAGIGLTGADLIRRGVSQP